MARCLLILLALSAVTGLGDKCCYNGDSCGGDGCNDPTSWCSKSKENCEGNCKGHFCPAGGPSPPSPPTPTPSPSPPSPPGHFQWCPSADDLTISYTVPGHTPQLQNQGYTISGGGGVATKSAFNLLGGAVEFDIDFSGVHTGVNANIYTISPTIHKASGFNISDYCDGAKSDKSQWCLEVDWIESNGDCGGATTLHTVFGPGYPGCTAWGCRSSYHYNGKSSFHMRIEHAADGTWTTTRDGQVISWGSLSPSAGASDAGVIKSFMETKGAVIYSSLWTGWVPVEDCGKTGDLGSSHFSVKNLKINGAVVQGPTPTACASKVIV